MWYTLNMKIMIIDPKKEFKQKVYQFPRDYVVLKRSKK